MTDLSITTDYCVSVGDPTPYLKRIANAGFSHLHWSHHFSDDYIYAKEERQAIRALLKQLGLRILDVHGSLGRQSCWYSSEESERRTGVALVKNRAELLTETDGEGVLIMHMPVIYTTDTPEEETRHRAAYRQFERSMEELLPELEKLGVVLALENMPNDTWQLLEMALAKYPARWVGLCYDSGHGNITFRQLDFMERNKSRLRALHLNDNDGVHDMHQPPGMGTVPWDRLATVIAASGYRSPMSYEITMRATPFTQIGTDGVLPAEQPESCQIAFLQDAYLRCTQFSDRVAVQRIKFDF